MKLTTKEKKWFADLEAHLDAAPESLRKKSIAHKISSYIIGDRNVTVYDEEKLIKWQEENPQRDARDWGPMVAEAEAELFELYFPFDVESTAG